jgi:protein TonB
MTSNEILKADVLDILFENRNKSYGAYALRRQYDKRLMLALGIAMSSILLLFLLFPDAKQSIIQKISGPPPVETSIIEIPVTPPPPPPAAPPRRNFAEVQYTNYNIVRDIQVTKPSATIDQLNNGNISTHTNAGDIPDGTPPPPPTTSVVASAPSSNDAPSKPFEVLERQPEFPGGIKALADFLSRNLVTPSEMEAGEKKTVYVKFIVNEDGTVTQFEVVKSAGTMYDKEVLRVMKKMPKWKPAIQNGKNVTVAFTQPVTFQTVEE